MFRLCVFLTALTGLTAAAADRSIEFNRDVLPILSDKCFACHGPDAAAKKIPFRLDSEAAAKADLGGGRRAVADGNPEASELVHRIITDKKALRMPPVYSGLALTEPEIGTLRAWIAQGAKWQQHWAFIAPVRPELPAVKTAGWAKNPIDAFVLARLEREGLAPSAEAPREKLIRRVSLDLTGLPPTLAEIDAFVNDRRPDAYERVVDRLLASPRYGERMASRWLEAARYADSNGYQYDAERVMWRWRDWVIDAFNRNEAYDRFTQEQIAGDLLPGSTLDQKIATGFNRNHRANTEDGIIAEEYAVEYVVDRVETTSTVFMGVTLGCARCHNHKYDPFTQKEFYQMFAYFNNVPELGRAMKYGNSPPVVAAPTAAQREEKSKLDARMQVLEGLLARKEGETGRAQRDWERGYTRTEHWGAKNGLAAAFPGETALDGKNAVEAGDKAGFDIEDRFSIAGWVYADGAPDGGMVSRKEDKPLGRGYGVQFVQGKVHVNLVSTWADDAIRLETEETLAARRRYHLAVTYDGSRMAEGVNVYIDGKAAKVKVEANSLYRPFRNAGKAVQDPLRLGGGWGSARRFRGRLDDVRIYGRVLAMEEIEGLAGASSLGEIARKEPAARTASEQYQLRREFLENAAPAEIKKAWRELSELRESGEALERTFPTVMVMAERPQRKDTFVLQRGAYNVPGEKVVPGVPGVLPALPAGAPADRLGLARWLTSAENPLLARVTVNRFWQMYFGTGIVKTAEDFGRQGEWPSHPELLDWLAVEFASGGWDVKAMQKLMVTSAAYRQRSEATPEMEQRDPENRLLARGPRARLPAETIRDQALFAAGLLVEKLGGPSVKPYQPAGLWKEIGMQDMDYTQGRGEDLHRRSLYTFWKRTVAPPMQAAFDAALRESCTVRETRTNTPLQALNLMNDVTFLEAGRFVGQRMMREGGNDAGARLRYGFRLVTGRAATEAEEGVLRGNLQYHMDYFAGKPEEMEKYLGLGDSQAAAGLNRRELAAYASVGSLLLNLDETITKE